MTVPKFFLVAILASTSVAAPLIIDNTKVWNQNVRFFRNAPVERREVFQAVPGDVLERRDMADNEALLDRREEVESEVQRRDGDGDAALLARNVENDAVVVARDLRPETALEAREVTDAAVLEQRAFEPTGNVPRSVNARDTADQPAPQTQPQADQQPATPAQPPAQQPTPTSAPANTGNPNDQQQPQQPQQPTNVKAALKAARVKLLDLRKTQRQLLRQQYAQEKALRNQIAAARQVEKHGQTDQERNDAKAAKLAKTAELSQVKAEHTVARNQLRLEVLSTKMDMADLQGKKKMVARLQAKAQKLTRMTEKLIKEKHLDQQPQQQGGTVPAQQTSDQGAVKYQNSKVVQNKPGPNAQT